MNTSAQHLRTLKGANVKNTKTPLNVFNIHDKEHYADSQRTLVGSKDYGLYLGY